jgi:hypothetical protein
VQLLLITMPDHDPGLVIFSCPAIARGAMQESATAQTHKRIAMLPSLGQIEPAFHRSPDSLKFNLTPRSTAVVKIMLKFCRINLGVSVPVPPFGQQCAERLVDNGGPRN